MWELSIVTFPYDSISPNGVFPPVPVRVLLDPGRAVKFDVLSSLLNITSNDVVILFVPSKRISHLLNVFSYVKKLLPVDLKFLNVNFWLLIPSNRVKLLFPIDTVYPFPSIVKLPPVLSAMVRFADNDMFAVKTIKFSLAFDNAELNADAELTAVVLKEYIDIIKNITNNLIYLYLFFSFIFLIISFK